MTLKGRTWLRILAGAITGLLAALGLFVVLLVLSGAYPRWEKLPPVGSPVTEWSLFSGCPDSTLYVKTADGSPLTLRSSRNASWGAAYGDARGIRFSPLSEPCDLSSTAFSLMTFPPASVRACLQSDQTRSIKSIQEAYALDSQGNLWRWRKPPVCSLVDSGGALTRLPVVLGVYAFITTAVIVASWSLMWSLKKWVRQARSTRSTPN